jgi:hypothetical protein
MSFARRFLTGFRETETSQPGLELNEDGTVDLVNPDGSRTTLPGSGGSLPSQWTVDADGNLFIDSTGADSVGGANGVSGVVIRSTTLANDSFIIQDENGQEVILMDPFGTIVGSFLDFSTDAQQDDAPTLKLIGETTRTQDTVVCFLGGHKRFSVSGAGEVIVQDAAGNTCFKIADDGSVHIKTGTSIIADL